MSSPLLQGLPPIVGGSPSLLILGNMPSVLSLTAGQYYGNPRNAFWRIAGELFGFDAQADYDVRVASLISARVAVWDVLESCRRPGSLDSAVERDSMAPNDFAVFFDRHPSITRVFFNGAAAEANYAKLVGMDASVTYARLPSTSPAHTLGYPAKLDAWRVITS
ncbi:MAG: DNA-deoxyinosine glycosylase [Mycobacterium sp.]|nr:DNA-deoxyinosine glycosylase [Mycobacterium sp.]